MGFSASNLSCQSMHAIPDQQADVATAGETPAATAPDSDVSVRRPNGDGQPEPIGGTRKIGDHPAAKKQVQFTLPNATHKPDPLPHSTRDDVVKPPTPNAPGTPESHRDQAPETPKALNQQSAGRPDGKQGPRATAAAQPAMHQQAPRPAGSPQAATAPSPAARSMRQPLQNAAQESEILPILELCRRILGPLMSWEYSCLAAHAVEDNGNHNPCVQHNVVSIQRDGKTCYLHANKFSVSPTPLFSGHQNIRTFTAGQAPRTQDACDKLLDFAIQSRQGIFQIVHPDPEDPTEPHDDGTCQPIILQLLAHPPGQVGGRYDVLSFTAEEQDKNYRRYLLKVRCNENGNEITIPITQVGLCFDNALLRGDEIEFAQEALEKHVETGTRLNQSVTPAPVMISQAGVGRNAVMIVYSTILEAIKDGRIMTASQVDDALVEIITEGRRSRGPHFIHSDKQLDELRTTLIASLPQQDPPSVAS